MDDKKLKNAQHPIPQNFMDVEFKIIGDLTMRQFVYLTAFGGPAYIFYISLLPGLLKWPLVVFFALLAFVLVAVPIDDRGADEWIVNFIRAVFGVNQRVFRKTGQIPKSLSMQSVEFIQAGVIATASTSSRRKVEEYIKGISRTEEKPDQFDFNFTSRKYIETKPSLSDALIQRETQKTESTNTTSTIQETTNPAFEEIVLFTPTVKEEEESKKIDFKKKAAMYEMTKLLPEKLKILTSKQKNIDLQDELRTTSSSSPGRKFISFSKKEAEDVILPIRGEKSISIFDRTPLIESALPKKDIKTLTKELEQITKEVKSAYGIESFRSIDLNNTSQENQINNISGIVLSPNETPLANLDIQILDENNNLLANSISNEKGIFNFYNFKTGKYQLKVANSYLHGFNFDIINLNVLGFPYPQIKILGKNING